MNDNPRKIQYSFQYRIAQNDPLILALRQIQQDLIEAVVEEEQRQGFPEVQKILSDIWSR